MTIAESVVERVCRLCVSVLLNCRVCLVKWWSKALCVIVAKRERARTLL